MSTLIHHPLAAEQDERIITLFGVVNRSLEAFEKLTALNVQAIRFGLGENQQMLGKALSANNVAGTVGPAGAYGACGRWTTPAVRQAAFRNRCSDAARRPRIGSTAPQDVAAR